MLPSLQGPIWLRMLPRIEKKNALLQGVLALCEFHYCEFRYCSFSKLYTARPRDTRILVPEKNRAAQNRTS